MLQLSGAPAFSAFRIAKLCERVQQEASGITGLVAQFVHFVDLEQELSADESRVLRQLLGEAAEMPAEASYSIWVVPRIGTISPWSSKATDIAHNCGLASVRRIERGIRFDIKFLEGKQAGEHVLQRIFTQTLHPGNTRKNCIDTLLPDGVTPGVWQSGNWLMKFMELTAGFMEIRAKH